MDRLNPGDGVPWLSRPGILIPVFILAFAITIIVGTLTAREILGGRADATGTGSNPLPALKSPSASPTRPEPKTPKLLAWPMQGGGPAHSGAQAAVAGAPAVSGLREVWHSGLTGDAADGATGSAGLVYVAGDRDVKALDVNTGALKWRFASGGQVTSAPAVHGTTVVFTDSGGTLYGLDTTAGRVLWQRHADYTAAAVAIAAPAPGRAPWIYVATARGAEALDLAGLPQWAFATRVRTSTPLSVDAGKVYFASHDTALSSLDAITGKLLWSTRIGTVVVTPAAVDAGTVYVGSANGQISAVSTPTGQIQWRRRAGNSPVQPLVVGQQGKTKRVFAVAGRKVIALLAADGRPSWTHTAGALPLSAPSLTGGQLFLGQGDRVMALNPETGRPVWQKVLEGRITSSPVMSEGRLFVATSGRQLHAYGSSPGAPQVLGSRALPAPAAPRPLAPAPVTPVR
ncbi:PQQ-binding-like beta-propeller repeat protein [Streptomyces sp. NPDC051555]|uniref:outer membrane protein assembly factor BamB family protein n=1 Tax=Streptomyces sp. NPDC051555 TaxID=3365657 RepID=UPI0037AA4CBF